MENEAQVREAIEEFLVVARKKAALIADEHKKVKSSIRAMSSVKKKKLSPEAIRRAVETIRTNITQREEQEEAEIAELDPEQLKILLKIDRLL